MKDLNKTNNTLSEDYLAASQLYKLIGDIEQCATMLAKAAKKAKADCENVKNKLRVPHNKLKAVTTDSL